MAAGMNARQLALGRDGRGSNAQLIPAGHEWEYASFSRLMSTLLAAKADSPVDVGRPDKCFIDRLPNELLCAIFLVCGGPNPASIYPCYELMHDEDLQDYGGDLHSTTVIVLGSVCGRWRAVTRNYPVLWTLVDIAYPRDDAFATLKLCLTYSAGLPLALQICGLGIGPVYNRFMRIVAANAHRWTEISFRLLEGVDSLQPLLATPPGAFSALQKAHIDIRLCRTHASSTDTSLWRLLMHSPNLRVVDWTQAAYVRSGISLAPLQQLTHVGLHYATPDMLTPILSTCVKLEVLVISIYVKALAADPFHEDLSYRLPHLRDLLLCGSYDWSALLSCLVAPSLQRLELSKTKMYRGAIEGMLRRSTARLRMLGMHWLMTNQAEDVVALLHGELMKDLQIVLYERYIEGGIEEWEAHFDLMPFLPSHVSFYTTNALRAEEAYYETMPR
ncbi:hypothetical protein GGG16DRAFT_62576 [Schizophyllum commune]